MTTSEGMDNIWRWVKYAAYAILIQLVQYISSNYIMTNFNINTSKSLMKKWLYDVIMAGPIACILMMAAKDMLNDTYGLFIVYLAALFGGANFQIKDTSLITYGVGMAYSFYEGYLIHVIPDDGGKNFVGLKENIRAFAATNKVVFPVKKLFIIITKSLHCPPNLSHFNKANAEIFEGTYLEACLPLADVKKDVAGVKDRIYRNSVYKIYRGKSAPPVHVIAECATPLHTLYKVLAKKALFQDLTNVDANIVREDFYKTLKHIVDESPECKGQCQIVFFDDTNPDENLSDVLLNVIEELEPKFEEVIRSNNY